MSYVKTPNESKFGGLILPQETLAQMIRAEVSASASYNSLRRDNKNTFEWDTSMGDADADTLPYIDPLRWQARDLDRNQPLVFGSIDTIVDNVVATGVRPQSSIDWQFLGITEDEASSLQTQAERLFYWWANSPDVDVARVNNFWRAQAMVLVCSLIDGDIFTIRRYKPRANSFIGTCLQFVEADRAQTPPQKSNVNDRVYGGVEVDKDGAAVLYHFLRNHPGAIKRIADLGDYTTVPAYDSAGIRLCLHHFMQRRVGQHRGVSILAPVVELFKQLGRYTEAELTAAVVSGMFSVFIKTESSQNPILPGTIPGQIGGHQVTPKGSNLTRLQSGAIVELNPNEDVAFANPNRPNAVFDAFTDSIHKQIGVGIGLPKEVMLKNFVSSYSASRAALLEAWKNFRRRRAWLVDGFCQPTYEWVISECVARGYLDMPGFFDDPRRRRAWLGAVWRGAPMGQIDPLKEAKAAKEWLAMPGLTTVQQVAAEQFGTDYEDNLAQTRRERQQIANLPADPNAEPVQIASVEAIAGMVVDLIEDAKDSS